MKAPGSQPPSPALALQAKAALAALETLARLSRRRVRTVRVRPEGGEGPGVVVTVPREALDLFLEVLRQMAGGHAVTIVPLHGEWTTQQVADALNVSRPYVVRLLEEGRIPSRKVGKHRRVRAEDVLAYRARDEARRRGVLDELAAEAQKHGLGY